MGKLIPRTSLLTNSWVIHESIKHPISAVLITYNCGSTIDEVLKALSWCNETIVVDSGSTDETLPICEKHNCRVFYHPFCGYGNQKRYAVNLAKNDWIFSVDGDEVITPELKNEIAHIFCADKILSKGFYVPITLVFMGRIFRFGHEYKYPHLRLFNKNFANFNEAILHESVQYPENAPLLKNQIFHYSYKNISHYFEKFNTYTSLYATAALKKKKQTKFKITLKLPFEFFRAFILRRNILNGFPGFVWSVFSAYYSFVKLVKLYEIQKLKK
jgi:glycosyltransferase involved in cell wall biosynthesis